MDPERKRQLIWILGLLFTVLLVDQVTKALVIRAYPEGRPFFEGMHETFFYISHDKNPGLVGGAFRNQRIVAFLAPILATGVLVYLYRHLNPASKLQAIAYGLVAGGAVGNLVDRLRLGVVTDFLQFHFYFIPFDFPWKYYPAFNVADAAICTGVVGLMLGWYVVRDDNVPYDT